MSPYDVLVLAVAQIERATTVPMGPGPDSLNPDEPHGTLLLSHLGHDAGSASEKRDGAPLAMRVRCLLRAAIEGPEISLQLAMEASWKLTKYLAIKNLRLQDTDGFEIPNSRFTARKVDDGETDSVFEHPESRGKATMEETWIISIEVPGSLID